MKKNLSLVVLLSLFNGASAMIVDSPVKKLYSILAEDDIEVQFLQSLVSQCQTLKDMIGDLPEDSRDDAIPILMPSRIIQLLVDFHDLSERDRDEWFEAKTFSERVALFKLTNFLDYSHQTKFVDAVVSKMTTPENIEAILKDEITLDIAGSHEDVIKNNFINTKLKYLLMKYFISHGKTLSGHTAEIRSVCATPDGRKIITGCQDGTIKIWCVLTGKCEQTLGPVPGPHPIFAIDVTPDGNKIITGSDKTARIWNIRSGICEQTLSGHEFGIYSVRVTPDGRKVITGSDDNTAKIWDIRTGDCLLTLAGHTGAINSLNVTPDSSKVVTASYDNTVKVWDIETGVCKRTLITERSLASICLTTDGSKVITISSKIIAKIWDIVTGNCERIFPLSGHKGWINSACVTLDGNKLVTGSNDKTVKIWDITTGMCDRTLSGHTNYVLSTCLTTDGEKLITGSCDRTAIIWDIYNPRLKRILLMNPPIHLALLLNLVLIDKEAAKILIESSEFCKKVLDCSDPEIKEVIDAVINFSDSEELDEGSEEGHFGLIPEDVLVARSTARRILTRRNALIGAGVLGTGVGFYAAYKWWFKGE